MSIFQKFKKNSPIESQVNSSFNFFVFDLETTGLKPGQDEILEIAFIRLDSNVTEVERFSTLIKPQGRVKGTNIHGITEQDVTDAPKFSDVASKILESINKSILVAHNSKFDVGFLRAEYLRLGIDLPVLPSLCTLEIARAVLRQNDRFRLIDCCEAVGIKLNDSHTAYGDVDATAQLFRFFTKNGISIEVDDSSLPDLSSIKLESENQSNVIKKATRQEKIEKTSAKNAHGFHLINLLSQMPLHYALGETPRSGSVEYFEKIMEIFSDGVISVEEGIELGELAQLFGLDEVTRDKLHHEILGGIIRIALQDGTLDSFEKQELNEIANLLNISKSQLNLLLKEEKARDLISRVGEVLPLPDDWKLGEPLLAGDKIAFTGCDPEWRAKAEKLTQEKGLQLMGSVSSKTKLLVTDGSYSGNKMASAREHGVRVASPAEFEVLLKYVQKPGG